MLAERRPALLWPLPSGCPDRSLRGLLGGRADAGAVPLAVGGLEGWRTAEGARLADMDGEGEEREAAMPFVWIPGGIGRLILGGAMGAADDTATGPAGAIGAGELPPGAALRESAMGYRPSHRMFCNFCVPRTRE